MTRAYWLILIGALSLIVLEYATTTPHSESLSLGHQVVGFNLFYGLGGCLSIVIIAKCLGIFIQKPNKNSEEDSL